MNQILYTGKGKSHGPASLTSILRFFSISLIVFGVIFIGDGSYALYHNHVIAKSRIDNTVPEIAFEQEGNNAIVTVTHNKGISRVRYHWNNDVDTIVNGNMEDTFILDNISIPSGINTLHVTAIDENEKYSESSYDFAYDGISIELSVVDNTYMKITASDVSGLSYITYKWNSDEEITAYPNTENNTIIEQTTEIPTGLNTLSITAVNTQNKTLTKTQDVRGVHPPKVQLYIQDDYLIVMVTDEEGIDTIKQQIGVEEERVIQANGAKEFSYKYNIANRGNILVTITATDVEGVARTVKGKNY